MNQFRNEFRAAFGFGIPNRPVHIQNRGTIRVGAVIVLEVRPPLLAHDEIGNAVSIDIGEGGAVGFGECNVARIFWRRY